MINILGLSIERATELLAGEEFSVTLEEARSKKGVEGATQRRIIRQGEPKDGNVLLVYADFQTEPAGETP